MFRDTSIQRRGYEFEKIIADIFIYYGYDIQVEKAIEGRIDMHPPDLIIQYNEKPVAIEAKISNSKTNNQMLLNAREQVISYMEALNSEYAFIFALFVVDEKIKNSLFSDNKVVVFDLQNIMYLVSVSVELWNHFITLIPFTIENIEAKIPLLDIDIFGKYKESERCISNINIVKHTTIPVKLDATSKNKKYLEELSKISPGKRNAKKYEQLCTNIINYLFNNNLILIDTQKHSSKDMYIFDLICKIKETGNGFWNLLHKQFNSRYIIFEFKNYTNKITQKEIYTTEKYLYKTALRNVAIIITRKGIDTNGLKAIKGSLRENGKLIMVLTDVDLKNMLENDNFTASDYLEGRLDDFLMELDK